MLVLGIETSCDETGVALYDSQNGLLGHLLYSQAADHAQYGGVVPELASRDHIRKIVPIIEQLFDQCQISLKECDAVAYTQGPGLVGALLVGAMFGRSLGYALNIPTLGVHHLEAHIAAVMLEPSPPDYPFVALLVSGGHTQLMYAKALGDYQLLGESLDDAAGEAFDKVAKYMGLRYPGGPQLAKLAENGDPKRFKLPRPMLDRDNLDFSFSGLKTASLQLIEAQSELNDQNKRDIAASFQAAVVDILTTKCQRALAAVNSQRLVVAGGVGANQALRNQLKVMTRQHNAELFFPKLEFCTDNGAMVAVAGCQQLLQGKRDTLSVDVKARWPL